MRTETLLLLGLLWLRAAASAGDAVEIPFRWTPGQIEIQVVVEGRPPIWCVLDSGAEMSMIDAETAAGLKLGPKVRDGSRERLEGVTMVIGPVTLPKQPLTLWAMDNFRRQGRDIRGVIGCELFERYAVTIDYPRHVVILRHPSSVPRDPGATEIPITFAGRLPVVKATLTFAGDPIRARLMVDTGASQAVILRHPFASKHGLFGAEDRKSTSETLAAGLRTFVTLPARELALGSRRFPNPAVKAYGTPAGAGGYTSTDGLLGNDVLRHFVVTFDYSRKRLILSSPRIAGSVK